MAMVLFQAIIPNRGSACTSTQMASLAEAVNSRILQGAGDSHWRIPYYIFSVFFRKPRLDNGSAYSPENEFFDYYQFINPVDDDYFWPVAPPQTPEGANLQTNPINKFIFGMNYGLQDEEDGAYIFDREDVRASKAQTNLRGGPDLFAGYTFTYFTEVGLGDIDPDYTAFNFARDYLSDGYINGNTVNPAGHSYGGYYGNIPEVVDGDGCGVNPQTKRQYPKSREVLYEIDSKGRKKSYYTCPEGASKRQSYYEIENKPDTFNVVKVINNEFASLEEVLDKNKYHQQQYVSKVYLQREVKNNLLRVLYNYICYAKGFDFDWFFKNQYAYAPEIGAFGSATLYVNDQNNIVDFKSLVDRKRLIFKKINLDSNSGTQTLLIDNMPSMADDSNYTISTSAILRYKKAKFPNATLAEVTGTSNILGILSELGFLHVPPSQVPLRIYSFPNSKDSVLIPKGFAFQRFVVTSTNLKRFTIKVTIFGFSDAMPETLQTYDFDYSLAESKPGFQAGNALTRNQAINGFFAGGSDYIKFEITNIQFFNNSTGTVTLSPIFLYAYKPRIEDAYAMIRAATYYGKKDAGFDVSGHPFNGANYVEDWNPNSLSIDNVIFCKRLSNDLKRYGYIQESSIPPKPDPLHTNNDVELNSNAVFEALRRMSLYVRILKPDNFVEIVNEDTLKFNRYILQKYNWGRLKNSVVDSSTTSRRVPYSVYTSFSNSYAGGSASSYESAPELSIPAGSGATKKIQIFRLLKDLLVGQTPALIKKTKDTTSETSTVDFFYEAGLITTNSEDIFNNKNFLCDYYSSANIYDFSNAVQLDFYKDLQLALVRGLGVEPQTTKSIDFTPLSYYCPYDFIVFDAASPNISFIYCRFQDSFGNNWPNSISDTFISVKKYYVVDEKFTEFEFLGVTNSGATTLGAVLNSDLEKIGLSSVSEGIDARVYVIALKRSLDIQKGFDQSSIRDVLHLNSGGEPSDEDYKNPNANYFYMGKNGDPLLGNISSSGLDAGLTAKYVTANIINFPIKYTTVAGAETTFNTPYKDVDASNVIPYFHPITGETGVNCDSILDFVAAGTPVSNSTLTTGNKYKVSGGRILFQNVVYIDGDEFISPASGTYTSDGGTTPTVTEYKAYTNKVFDLTLNGSRFYFDKSTIDVDNPINVNNSFSLTAILNGFLESFAYKGIELDLGAKTFIKKHNGSVSASLFSSLTVEQYNDYLAGLSIKFSYLGNELVSQDGPNYSALNKYQQIEGRSQEDSRFWMAIYLSNNTEKDGSKQFFNFNDRVTLPTLDDGEYLRFSIPVNNFAQKLQSPKDISDTQQLYKNNFYQLRNGVIKITNGVNEITYTAEVGKDPVGFSPPINAIYTIVSGTPIVERITFLVPHYFQKGIYLSILNYFYLNDILAFYDSIKRTNYLEVESQATSYVEAQGLTTLRDAFQGIAADPDGVASNGLFVTQRYLVAGSGSINHNGSVYSASSIFTASSKTFDVVNGNPKVLPINGSNDPEGIVELAKPGGYTNEWVLWMNFLPYSDSAASEFKDDVYAVTGSPFYDRCHINSAGIPKSQENNHLNLGQELARYVEAPPSYRYMPLLNSKGQVFYTNVIGSEVTDGPSIDKKSKFYSSCKAIVEPYIIKRAYFKVAEPNIVYIEVHKKLNGFNSFNKNQERTDYNGLKDWLEKGTGTGNINFRIGDASLTNQNGLNQITSHSANGYKGSYYPRFFFLKLIPKPYADTNSSHSSSDSYMDHEHLKQVELYLAAMREGFSVSSSIVGTTSCEYLDGHLTPPDYTYENLFFSSGSLDNSGYFNYYGNKWPPLVTFSKQYNLVDESQGLQGPERNNDNPRGFGAIPRMGTYGEFYTSIAKAVNRLRTFRVSVPQNYFAQYNFSYSAESQSTNTDKWSLLQTGAGKNIYVANFSSDTSINPPPNISYERNLRRNDGFLETIGVNAGYSVDIFGASSEARNIANAYIIKSKTTAKVLVKPVDPYLLSNAYGSISGYLGQSIAVPISYQTSAGAGVIKEAKETVISDGCGIYFQNGAKYFTIESTSRTPPPYCEVTRNLTLEPPDLIGGTPYFGLFQPAPCTTTFVKDGVSSFYSIDTSNQIGLVGPKNFNSASSITAQIWEVGWRLVTPPTSIYTLG